MKLGVENMMEVYIKDKKRTKDLEAQLDKYNKRIESLTKEIEQLRKSAGKDLCKFYLSFTSVVIKTSFGDKRPSYARGYQQTQGTSFCSINRFSGLHCSL